jgi:hypothetical protein
LVGNLCNSASRLISASIYIGIWDVNGRSFQLDLEFVRLNDVYMWFHMDVGECYVDNFIEQLWIAVVEDNTENFGLHLFIGPVDARLWSCRQLWILTHLILFIYQSLSCVGWILQEPAFRCGVSAVFSTGVYVFFKL